MNERNDGHRKIFSLSPAEPDLGSLILQARDEVVEDNELSHGARLMFVRILDLSVRQASNVRPGVVTISQMKLGEKLGVSIRTIFNWKLELVRRRVVWMTCQPIPNAWPIDTYHVSAIHPPSNTGDKTSVEGLWGNGSRRTRPENLGGGARGSLLPVEAGCEGQVFAGEEPLILSQIASGRRNPLPASPAGFCGSQPQPASGGSRKILRAGAAKDCHGEPQDFAGGSRKILRAGAEADCRHKKAKVGGSSHPEGGTPPRSATGKAIRSEPDGFERWKAGLGKLYPRELEKLSADLHKKRRLATTDDAKAEIAKRLAAIDEALYGLQTGGPDVPQVKPKPTTTATTKPKFTEAELLDGARKLVKLGKAHLLSTPGRAALLKSPAGLSPAEYEALKNFPTAPTRAGV